MKYILYFYLSALLMTISAPSVSFGQNPTSLIPNSPTAATLANASDVPVNLSTGLPNLSINLFNLQGHDLSIPIVLRYSYDGFRPAQASSWVGMGWSLDAGGVITRTIRDKVDGTMASGNYDGTMIQAAMLDETNMDSEFLKNSMSIYDLQPDVYNFSFPGHSGKFILFKGKFYVSATQKLKVSGGLSGFTITTTTGERYIFNQVETTNPKGTSGSPYNLPSSYNSSWYLTRIENAAGTEAISLTYSTEGKLSNAGAYTQRYEKLLGTTVDTQPPSASSSFPTYVNPVRLSAIATEKHTAYFYPGEIREDLNQSAGGALRRLRSIEVYSQLGIVKKFNFHGSYIGTTAKYLFLDSLSEVSRGDMELGTDSLLHKFEYEELDPVSKHTAYVDHYGFYTGLGEFNGSMLIPSTLHSWGVDRTPNFIGTKMGALKKIIYPTSGQTVIEYEQNRFGSTIESISQSVNAEAFRTPGSGQNVQNGQVKVFTLTQTQNVDVYLTRVPFNTNGDGIAKNQYDDFRIYGSAGVILSGQISYEAENSGKFFSVTLPAGTYSLRVYTDWRESNINALLFYSRETGQATEGKMGPGIRMKAMVQLPNPGRTQRTEYEYKLENGFSSGSPPPAEYDQKPFKRISVFSDRIEEKDYNIISSYVRENSASGLPHSYSSVVVKKSWEGKLQQTRHEFAIIPGSFLGNEEVKVTLYKEVGGSVVPAKVKYTYYSASMDTLFKSVQPYQTKQVDVLGGWWAGPLYDYAYDTDFISMGWKYISRVREVSYEGPDSVVVETRHSYDVNRNLGFQSTTASDGAKILVKNKYPQNYAIMPALVSANFVSPVVERQVWRKNGADSILVTASISEYDPTSFRKIKDYDLEGIGISMLNSEALSGGRYTSLLSDTRYKLRTEFEYDAAGRMVLQRNAGAAPVSYWWGYNANYIPTVPALGQKNYPVAEVMNAHGSEVFFNDFEDDPNAIAGPAHSGFRYHVGDYEVSFSLPNSKPYVITYFYLSGNSWHLVSRPYIGSVVLSEGDGIDDVAIYPSDAQLSSFSYDFNGQLKTKTDSRGNTTSYTYDGFGRLHQILDREMNIVSQYEYSRAPIAPLYYNTELVQTFQKNDCSSGVGSQVSFVIPYGEFSSLISMQDANSKAYAHAAANGQVHANAIGTCLSVSNFTFNNDTHAPFLGDILTIEFRDSSTNALQYSFNQLQVQSGFSVPKGTYKVSIATSNLSTWGWGTLSLTIGTTNHLIFNDLTDSYILNNVVVDQDTAALYMSSEIF